MSSKCERLLVIYSNIGTNSRRMATIHLLQTDRQTRAQLSLTVGPKKQKMQLLYHVYVYDLVLITYVATHAPASSNAVCTGLGNS